MYCNKCGNELKETDKFCAACGAPADREEAPVEPVAEPVAEPTPAVDVNGAPLPNVPHPSVQYASRADGPAPEVAEAAGSPGFSIAGFVLALIAICCCWIPVIGVIFALVGLALSIVGVCKGRVKGLAIAGIVISAVAILAGVFLSIVLIGGAAYIVESNVLEDLPRIINDQIEYGSWSM